jgi:hypothetical protein
VVASMAASAFGRTMSAPHAPQVTYATGSPRGKGCRTTRSRLASLSSEHRLVVDELVRGEVRSGGGSARWGPGPNPWWRVPRGWRPLGTPIRTHQTQDSYDTGHTDTVSHVTTGNN